MTGPKKGSKAVTSDSRDLRHTTHDATIHPVIAEQLALVEKSLINPPRACINPSRLSASPTEARTNTTAVVPKQQRGHTHSGDSTQG